MKESTDRLITLLSEVFCVDKSSITDATSPSEVEAWDSFTTLRMITMIEHEFQLNLDLKEVVSIKSVKDIKTLLVNKGVDMDF